MSTRIEAYLFDLDGVLTPTVDLHRKAWQVVFDQVFAAQGSEPFRDEDYLQSLDGRPRFAGVATLLAARGITLPEGQPHDEGLDTVCGIGNLKNRTFTELLTRDGIKPYPGSLLLLNRLAELRVPLAVVSSSKNAEPVLRAAGLRDRFPVVVDGIVAAEQGLPGKPHADTFLHAAALLGVAPEHTAVFEDAVSGVQAARSGGFASVIGVDRGAGRAALLRAGAHLVVQDLASYDVTGDSRSPVQPFRDFGADPWRLRVTQLDPALAAEDETIFALSNGYLGLRGNHEEGLPLGSHGTFINGLHETWPIRHAEYAYGFAEHGQTMVNAPDAKTIRIYIDDERLNLGSSDLREVSRTLDFREGTLDRSLLWVTATGKKVRVETRRMVSFTSKHMATITMSITVLNDDAELTVSSLIVNRQDLGRIDHAASDAGERVVDPRKSEQLSERTLLPGPALQDGQRSVMSFQVRNSGMVLGVGIDHEVIGEGLAQTRVQTAEDRVRHVFQGKATRGNTITLVKTITYHASETATLSEIADRCVHTLDRTATEPLERRWSEQRAFLTQFWERSDVAIDAEPGVQQAVRWNLFQLAQAAARADGRGIAAKGLTGSGYSGHYFWDSEIFVLPFLTYTTPLWAKNALRSRLRMLPKARLRATQLSEEGALFPWRTINGDEASAYYAAGTAAYHINADITYACARYFFATGDLDFLLAFAEIPIETARLWVSLGFWATDADGMERFHIHGVTGPDEYTTVVNDNLFTNVMARFNLRIAVSTALILQQEHPEAYAHLTSRLGLTQDEIDAWQKAADGMSIPYAEELGIHPQDAHFLEREVWDLAATPPDKKPLLLHFHPLVIYRFQVLKQADVVLALLLASNEFSDEEKRRNFEYYDALTTGDSSLSGVVQSVIAAEVGYRDLAYRYFTHALQLDLANLHHNSVDGVHIASAGGIWMALVQGFAGMRDAERTLSFDPRLPAHWQRVSFRLQWRQRSIRVTLRQESIEFETAPDDPPISVWVRGAEVALHSGQKVTVALANQGPNLGVFRGLSAGILPRDGESLTGPDDEILPLTGTIHIPTLPPTQAGGAGYEDPE